MITEYWNKLIMPSIFVTLEIVFFTVLIGFVLGFIMAILLTLYGPTGLRYKKDFMLFSALSLIRFALSQF